MRGEIERIQFLPTKIWNSSCMDPNNESVYQLC
jgi:hypothetical protein